MISQVSLRRPAAVPAPVARPRCASVRPVRAEPPSTPAPPTPDASEAQGEATPSNVCAACGVNLADAPSGCDNETGRIVGGVGALPGMGWFPIKAYRPCPKLGESGRRYKRQGQITDEMLFGRGKK